MGENNNQISTDLKLANILVVDDEPANVRLLEKMLKAAGYSNVVTTLDPLQALPLYLEHESDLILLDINMPQLDGYGVMEQLKTETEGNIPPILMLTAQSAQEFIQRALNNGAKDYVTKPFDMNELLARVKNMLEVQMAHKFMRNQNAILEQKVKKRTQEIYETRMQVVRCLGRAAEYRDEETGLHIVRMSKMSAILGKAVGMDEGQCDLLLNASPMHDIGKIGIPDNVLLKPGKFEPHEWEIMKTHAQIGFDILSEGDSDLMAMASEIAISHHEKWNGSGYPKGLAGEDIPIVGRITALADVFDALTSVRPYKKAWTIENSVNLIKEESGKHFDPNLVNLFIENLPEIVSIKETYAEPEE